MSSKYVGHSAVHQALHNVFGDSDAFHSMMIQLRLHVRRKSCAVCPSHLTLMILRVCDPDGGIPRIVNVSEAPAPKYQVNTNNLKLSDYELQLVHHYAKPFRLALQETINLFKQLPSSVPQKTQLLILDSLHTYHAARCMAMFQVARKADETKEEKNKRWGTFNDTLRRIIFGTYKATSLPTYIQTEIRELGCPRWKSFFIQRILVYHWHSHLTSKKNQQIGSVAGNI
jgi:hypothetical protein